MGETDGGDRPQRGIRKGYYGGTRPMGGNRPNAVLEKAIMGETAPNAVLLRGYRKGCRRLLWYLLDFYNTIMMS